MLPRTRTADRLAPVSDNALARWYKPIEFETDRASQFVVRANCTRCGELVATSTSKGDVRDKAEKAHSHEECDAILKSQMIADTGAELAAASGGEVGIDEATALIEQAADAYQLEGEPGSDPGPLAESPGPAPDHHTDLEPAPEPPTPPAPNFEVISGEPSSDTSLPMPQAVCATCGTVLDFESKPGQVYSCIPCASQEHRTAFLDEDDHDTDSEAQPTSMFGTPLEDLEALVGVPEVPQEAPQPSLVDEDEEEPLLVCGKCKRRPPRNGRRSCDKCYWYFKNRTRRWRKEGLCVRCGRTSPSPGFTRCEDCLAYCRKMQVGYDKKRRAKSREVGRCTRCNRREAEVGKKQCVVCNQRVIRDEFGNPLVPDEDGVIDYANAGVAKLADAPP